MKKKFFLFLLIICHIAIQAIEKMKQIGGGYIFSFRHYPKFYGDPNTIQGDFWDRSFIFDDKKHVRKILSDRGIYLDATLWSFWATNAAGGEKSGYGRYNGNTEYWLVIDTGKVGLWPRGALMIHAESSWTVCDSINDDVGSLLAPNSRSRVPLPNKGTTTLSEVALAQFFTDNIGLRAGKLDATGPIDGMNVANNGRFQFLYTGLVNNPIIYNFTNYTSIALMPFFRRKNNELLFFISDADGQADKSGMETTFNGNTSYCVQYTFSPKARKRLPGNYRLIYAHVRKPITGYEIDARNLAGKDIPELIIQKKCSNHGWLMNFDQYLWIYEHNDKIEYRKFLPPVGIILFGRAGWEPEDRNVIDQFYSIGISGYGLCKKRFYDQWGIGYAATHISMQLREDLKARGIYLNRFEHGFEAFYNAQCTPSLHLSVHMQVIRPPLKSKSPALVFISRLQTDF